MISNAILLVADAATLRELMKPERWRVPLQRWRDPLRCSRSGHASGFGEAGTLARSATTIIRNKSLVKKF